MLARIMLFLIVVAASAGIGHSQSIGQLAGGLPEPCRTKASESLVALEKRKDRLERAIARAREKSGQATADEDSAKRLSKTQTDLLEVLFQIDCVEAKQALAKAEVPIVGAAPAPPELAPSQESAPSPPPGAAGKSKFAPSRSLRKVPPSPETAA